MKKILQHPAIVIAVIAIAALAVGIYAYFSLTKHPTYEYSNPVVKNLTESVSVTGGVKAAQTVDLAFERAGKVVSVPVAVGDKVYQGQALVYLNADDALNDLASAKAALALAQAQAGLQDTGLTNAQLSLTEAQKSMLDKIQNAYFSSDDAVRTETNPLFTIPLTYTPQFLIVQPDYQFTVNIQNERADLENILTNWNAEISSASSTSDFEVLSAHARQNILIVKKYLDDVASALNNALVNPSVSVATMTNWKLAVTTARGSVSGALVALSGADSQLIASQSAFDVAEQQVQNGTSGNASDVAAPSLSQAQIDAAQVNVDRANSALAKTALRAPFSGVVSQMDAKVGQTVSVGVPLAGMISDANYQIEGFVSESDAGKINIGQIASTTLDAYGSSVNFPTKVALIDPAATVQNGVSSYKVTFQFVGNDVRVKAGMTANISVFVASKNGVLTVPSSAIVRRGVDDYVLVSSSKNSNAVLRQVTTGIIGDDGSVEIVSGITTTDLIVTLN